MTSDPSTLPSKCLKCRAELNSPIVCTGCRALYPVPRSADYFDLLGLPRTYHIDAGQLRAAFRAIARNVHPDRFTAQPGEVGSLATRLSAEVNEAVNVLHDPVQRAAYMLEQAGGPSAAELREVPGELLAEVMRLREQIEEANLAEDDEGRARLRKFLEDRRTQVLEIIASLADRLATSDDEEKKAFRRRLNSVKYFDNLLEQLPAAPARVTSEPAHDR